MSVQIIGGAAISIVGLATLLFAVFAHLRKRARVRERAVREAATEIQRCWQVAERVPPAYMPPSLKRLLARIVQSTSSRTLKLDPKNSFLREQETKSRHLLASAARDPAPQLRTMLTPKDRKVVTESLRELKRLAQNAMSNGLIANAEGQRESLVIDAVMLRIMVDHLKQNALNSEAIGKPHDATQYFNRAIQALSSANQGNRFKDEIANLERELDRLRRGGAGRGDGGRSSAARRA